MLKDLSAEKGFTRKANTLMLTPMAAARLHVGLDQARQRDVEAPQGITKPPVSFTTLFPSLLESVQPLQVDVY